MLPEIALCGFPLRIEGRGPGLETADIVRLAGALFSVPPIADRESITLRIEPLRGPSPSGEILWQGEGLTGTRTGDVLGIQGFGAEVAVTPEGSLAILRSSPDFAEQDEFTRLQVFLWGLVTILRNRGCLDLHAAALVSPRGAGLVLLGPSGSGKTTVARDLARAGWSLASDDMVALDVQVPESPTVRPIRRAVGVTDPSGRKHLVDPEKLFHGSLANKVPPTILCQSRVEDIEQTRLVRAAPREICVALLVSMGGVLLAAPTTRTQMDAAAFLSGRALGFSLLLGRDALRNPATCAALFDRILPP